MRGTRGLRPGRGGDCCAGFLAAAAPGAAGCGRLGNCARLTHAGKCGTGDAAASASDAPGECLEIGSYGDEEDEAGGPHSVAASPLASSWRRATPFARSDLRCSPRGARPALMERASSLLLSQSSSCFEGAAGAAGIDLTSSIIFVKSAVSPSSFCSTLAHVIPRSGS